MRLGKKLLCTSLATILIGGLSCAPLRQNIKAPYIAVDNEYDYNNLLVNPKKTNLEELADSVEMLSLEAICTIEKYNYILDENNNYVKDPESPTGYKIIMDENKPLMDVSSEIRHGYGTASCIGLDEESAYFLVTKHQVVLPAKKIEYLRDEKGRKTNVVDEIWTLKDYRIGFYSDTYPNSFNQVEIVAVADDIDAAIIRAPSFRKINFGYGALKQKIDYKPLRFKWGDSDKLKLGNMVYASGFGGMVHQTVSGHVTGFDRTELGRELVLIDTLINPGHSGSPVVALMDGEYELVMIATSSSFFPFNILSAGGIGFFRRSHSSREPRNPVNADLKWETLKIYRPGINAGTPINEIKEWLLSIKPELEEKGLGFLYGYF